MRSPSGNMLFSIAVATAFTLGIYSLLLASVNIGTGQQATGTGLLRTATAADADRIEIALGALTAKDLVYVVLDTPTFSPDPEVAMAAREAARVLTDTGMEVSVRLLDPEDPDFAIIVAQNGIDSFPAVMVVKKDGGIVLVMDEISEKKLLHAYRGTWGKASSCNEARSAIY